MRRKIGYIMLAVSCGLLVTGLITGCDDDDHSVVVRDDAVTFVNEHGYRIIIQPFDIDLVDGESVDVDIGGDIVHVVVFRASDGLVLLEVDAEAGEVWVIR